MQIQATLKTNLKTKKVTEQVHKAAQKGMLKTVVAVASDTIKGSPWKTGNNRRSIAFEVSGLGSAEYLETGEKKSAEVVDGTKVQGAIYSTSGYGGFLETGTAKMAARPYFRPALDKHVDELAENIKEALNE
jgi:HK97 gp10 family phage protein